MYECPPRVLLPLLFDAIDKLQQIDEKWTISKLSLESESGVSM